MQVEWPVVDNHLLEYVYTASVDTISALSIYHDFFVLNVTIFNDTLF